MNEINIPIIDDEKFEISILINEAPKISGIAIKNENRIASSLFTPNNNNVEIVIPDLEIPGNNANICNRPTIKAIFKFIFFEPKLNFVKNNTIAVNKNEYGKSLISLKCNSIKSLNNMPIIEIGIQPIKIKKILYLLLLFSLIIFKRSNL